MKSPKQNRIGRLRHQTLANKSRIELRRPYGRSLKEFLPLSHREQELVAVSSGHEVPWQNGSRPLFCTPENIVRAEFLRFMLLGGDSTTPICGEGVQLHNAWITGELDLWSSTISLSFRFLNCTFENEVILAEAHVAGGVGFYKCSVPAIHAAHLHSLRGLTIFDCDVKDGFNLSGARIEGDVHCGKTRIQSINGTDAIVSGKLRLSNGFSSHGIIDFSRAQIGGAFDCSGAQLDGAGKEALVAVRMLTGGDLLIARKFHTKGRVRLTDSKIGGGITASDAVFDGNGSGALNLDGAEIGGSIVLSRTVILGQFRMITTRITHDLTLSGAKLRNSDGMALIGDRSVIGGGMFLGNEFEANGVRFVNATVGAGVTLTGAKLRAVKKLQALNCDQIQIAGNMFFTNGFSARGQVCLSAAKISGSLIIEGSELENEGGDALFCQGMVVAQALQIRRLIKPVSGVSLSSAHVGRLVDDEASWGGNLLLNGFVYGSLAGIAPTDAIARLRWLDKQRLDDTGRGENRMKFKPQPWRQLRKVLLDLGHFASAREVAIAYEKRLREIGHIGQTANDAKSLKDFVVRKVVRGAHDLFGVLIGYGYEPIRLVKWMILVWTGCGAIFWGAAKNDVMAPSDPLVFQNPVYAVCKTPASPPVDTQEENFDKKITKKGEGNWYLCEKLPEEYTGFSPLAYSLDVLLPLVDLQQQNDWAPKVPTPKEGWFEEFVSFSLKHFVRLILWFEIIFGWVASLLLVAVLSGLTKRADE